MKISEIKALLENTGLPHTYRFYPIGQVPPLPYLVWYLASSDNFAADDRVYKHAEVLVVELYTKEKDPDTEAAVEAVFNSVPLVWSRDETYLEDEKMYEVLYETEIFINGEQD